MTRSLLLAAAVIVASTIGLPSRAIAQTPPTSAGPLVLQPVSSAVVFAPDVKVTSVHGTTGILTGGYVGKLFEERVLFGGGAYWLVDPRDQARMFYAGAIFGGSLLASDQFNLSVRALAGFGDGTVYENVQYASYPHGSRPHHGGPAEVPPLTGGIYRVGFHDVFAVFEPEARMAVRVSDLVSVNVGLGYRINSADGWMNEAFRGVVGSVGVAFAVGN